MLSPVLPHHPACPGARTPRAPGPRPFTAPTMSARPRGLPSDGGPQGLSSPTLLPIAFLPATCHLCSSLPQQQNLPKNTDKCCRSDHPLATTTILLFHTPCLNFPVPNVTTKVKSQIRGNMLDQVCVLIQRFNLKTTITKYKNSASICRNITLGNRIIFFRPETGTYWPLNF